MDGGAWWAHTMGLQSQTRRKQLSTFHLVWFVFKARRAGRSDCCFLTGVAWSRCWALGSSLSSVPLGAQCLWSPPSGSPGRTEQDHLLCLGGPGGSAGATLSPSTPCFRPSAHCCGLEGARATQEVPWLEPKAWLLETNRLVSGASTHWLRHLSGLWRSEVSGQQGFPRALANSLLQIPHPGPAPHMHTPPHSQLRLP